MAEKNKVIIFIVVGSMCGLWLLGNIPKIVANASLIFNSKPDPVAMGQFTGVVIPAIVALVCVIYGVRLLKQSANK